MITFKHLNKCFCGMLILVCCLFGDVGIVEGKTVDITDRCVKISVSAGDTVSYNDICSRAGLGSCYNAGGLISVYSNNDCTGTFVSSPTASISCNDSADVIATGKSALADSWLVCKEKSWGALPQPDNVPGDFKQSIKNTTDWILGFVGMIAVLMLIWGGIGYLTSAGDEDKAKTGKKTISYALIGLVVAGIAYALVDVIVTVIL